MRSHKLFVKTILVIFIAVFAGAGIRWLTEDAETDKVRAEPTASGATANASRASDTEQTSVYPPIEASSVLIRELDSDTDILNYNAEMRWPLASITKLMTAVVAFEKLPDSPIITISDSALATEGIAGNFKTGERYTLNDLVRAMMAVSSNDAAEAIAQAYDERILGSAAFKSSLSKSAYFTAAMNKKALFLGMTETLFGDSTGLSMVSQSTAKDLQKLIRYLNQTYPGVLETTSRSETVITELSSGEKRTLKNINFLAGRPEFLGGKTGRTDESGENLISLFSHQGKTYVIIVFGARDRFTETTKLFDWVKKSTKN